MNAEEALVEIEAGRALSGLPGFGDKPARRYPAQGGRQLRSRGMLEARRAG